MSDNRVRCLIEAVPDALFRLSASGRVECASAQFQTMTGEPLDDVVDTFMWPDLIHPEDLSQAEELWATALAEKYQFEIRYRLRAPGDAYRWVIVRARPCFDDQNNLNQWFGSVTDIHDLTMAEAHIRKLNDTLEVRVAERTHQLCGLASRLAIAEQEERLRISRVLHDDLQQLLHGVQIQLMRMKVSLVGRLAQEAKTFLEGSEEWLERSIALTRQLTVDLSPPIFNEEGLVAAIRWIQKQMKERHDLDVEVIADHEFKIENKGIRVLLYEIVRELLFNTAKHGHTPSATVELKDATDGGILLSVRDEGTGFDVNAVEKRAGERRGFGLFNVREQLNLLDGSMEITSSLGKGTRIDMRLPLASGFSRSLR